MEKPKNLYVPPTDINQGGESWWGRECRAEENKGEKKMGQL